MGIDRHHLNLIMTYVPKRGRVLSLGYPDINCSDDSVMYATGLDDLKHRRCKRKNTQMLDSVDLFKRLGFELFVVDIVPTEGMELICDLSKRELPYVMHNAFDLVIDPGTLEHLQYPGIGIENVYWMTKPGGFILHHTPFRRPKHGLWGLKPKLFRKLYETNGCEIIFMSVLLPNGDSVPVSNMVPHGNMVVLVRKRVNNILNTLKPIMDSVK